MPPDSVIYYLVSLLVAKMFELKERQYQEQIVSIFEFTLLLNGMIFFNDFQKYSETDLGFINHFLRQEMDENYKFLMVTEVAKIKLKKKFVTKTPAEREKILKDKNEFETSDCCPEMLSRLEKLSNEEKVNICNMHKFLLKSEEQHYNDFPTRIDSVEPLIDVNNNAYRLGELLNWLTSNFDLDKPHGLPLAEWVRNLLFPPETLHHENVSTYDGYIKIDTLPKIMQFMIECYQDSSFQQSSVENNSKQVSIFKSEKVDKLFEISKQKGMTHTSNRKEQKGISPTALKYIIDFIQKD
jgi:hypothetical protein